MTKTEEIMELADKYTYAYMEGYEAAKHEVRDACHAEIDELKAELANIGSQEPAGYVNTDELDNMLDDRTATLSPVKNGWYTKPLYVATKEHRCKFPSCHSEEYQQALVKDIERELIDGAPIPTKYNPTPVYTSNCIRHPAAPHGVDVEASWRAGHTVCVCQSWTPGETS